MPAPSVLNHSPASSLRLPGLALPVALLLVLIAALPVATAQEVDEAASTGWTLGLALGHGRRSNPFIESKDIDIPLVLDLAWYGERFFFDNGDFGATLASGQRLAVNALLTFDNERNYFSYLGKSGAGIDLLGYLGTDGEFQPLAEPDAAGGLPADVEGELLGFGLEEEDLVLRRLDSELPDRDFALHAGLELLAISPWGDWQAQVLSDVSGRHDGQTLSLSWTYPWYLPRGSLALSTGVEWRSREMIDYYYGVLPHEALPGRPAYRAGSGSNSFVRFAAQFELSRRWQLVAVLERDYLSDEIRHSPVINRDTRDTFFLGLYYRIF